MNSAIERLLSLRVADVMSRNVVSVSSRDTMSHAARTLVEHSISGAPVLDENKSCTGMLSAIDFVKRQACNFAGVGAKGAILTEQNAHYEGVDVNDDEECQADSVSRHMTTAVQSITASETLLSAARMMCAEHIHRLPVLDKKGRIAGIVTALDIVAALVNAIEE